MANQWRGVLREYADRLDVTDATPIVTLGEGGTPLIPAPALSARTGAKVWVKYEGMNPTGSFKDRGMTMAVSKAVEAGAKAVICASTGNTSASAAAYATHAGITAAVLVPQGKIAMGKLAQAIAHNAQLLQVQGNFDDCLDIARDLAANYPVHLVNSVNNDRIEGQKTAAFEVVEVLEDAPDFHIVPVGNAGNYTAYFRGYGEALKRGDSTKLPEAPPLSSAMSSRIPTRSPVPSASATLPRGSSPSLPAKRATATSGQFPTTRSSRPIASSRARSESSSSRPPPSASPVCSSDPKQAPFPPGRQLF
jgi:threonine synthase